MSNFSTFFPAAGGGGGILNEQVFSSSGSFDPAAAGLSVGDKIIILCVGGGGSGGAGYSSGYRFQYGGAGGYVQYKNHVLTSVSAISITIGAGGAAPPFQSNGNNGGSTTVGSIVTSSGGTGGSGYPSAAYGNKQTSQGPHWGATAMSGSSNAAAGSSAGPGLDGYGTGGGTYANYSMEVISGGATGGSSGASGSGGYSAPFGTQAGTVGIVKIYY
jgi:hypothetical protein